MADSRRFGRSEREYTGVPRRGLSNNQRFGRSERAYTGVTDRMGGKYDRFGPSEKRYSDVRYTPSGKGTTWGFTGDSRRKILGYDVGSRPPRGLASLIPREGIIGQDPRSSTYSLYRDQISPDDLRGYRASVADVAAANAEEERKRLNDQWRYDLTSPGSGIGLEAQEFGIPAGVNEYMGVEDWLGVVPKDPRDVGTLGDFESKYGHYRDTSNMGNYRGSVADAAAISGYDMPDRAKRNLSLLTDLERMGTDAYRFANTAPVSIGEREAFRSPASYQELFDRFTGEGSVEREEETPYDHQSALQAMLDRMNEAQNTPYRLGLDIPHPGSLYSRGGIASLRR